MRHLGQNLRATLAAATLLLGVGFSFATERDDRTVYVGAARLYNLPSLTIVYPSGGGAVDAETARFSADRRAAFLHEVHGIDVRVVPDEAFGRGDETGDNLLVLGWDNALLDRVAGGGFLVRRGDGWQFLGGVQVLAGEDLIFARRSPFDDSRRLIFWSRIDPELDRFSVLPFVASDYAVFDTYRIEVQGNYGDWDADPPTRDTRAEMDFRSVRSPPVRAGEGPRHVLWSHGGVRPDDVPALLEARERALATAEARIGPAGEIGKIDVYVYPDVDRKRERSSVPDPQHSVPRRMEMHLLLRHARSASPHEDLHLLAAARYGACRSSALYEGLALAYENAPEDTAFVTVVAALREADRLPTVADLLDEEVLRQRTREGTGFVMSAVLVRWLRERFGDGTFGKIYTLDRPDASAVATAVGLPIGELESAFRAHLTSLADGAGRLLAFRRAVAESTARREAGDDEAARAALVTALEALPDDPGALYGLGLLELEAGLLDDAERRFRRLLDLGLEATSRYRIYAHYQLANVERARGRTRRARRELDAMLELPDRYDSHRRAEEALRALDGGGR